MAKRARARRTYQEIFLDTLTKKVDGTQEFVGNKALREELGWDVERYNRIKGQLVDENRILVGRGHGGSVCLSGANGSKALSVFISYSHADAKMKGEFEKHLEPLRRLNLIDTWTDQEIKAGEQWSEGIAKKLESADIILLLVSIDFINSRYCYDVELDTALDRYQRGEAKVVPVILRNCLWQQSKFSHLQALPREARAVAAWSDRDEAYTNIAEGIKDLAGELLA